MQSHFYLCDLPEVQKSITKTKFAYKIGLRFCSIRTSKIAPKFEDVVPHAGKTLLLA